VEHATPAWAASDDGYVPGSVRFDLPPVRPNGLLGLVLMP